MAPTSVLVLGPTGGFGKFLVPELIRRKTSFKRIGAFVDITRPQDQKKSQALQNYAENGVEIVRVSPGDPEPFKVIAALGNHAIKDQPALIDLAVSAGVRHWYPSEFGTDLTVGDNWNERYYRDKVLTRKYLQQKAAEHPEFGHTYFLNGCLMEWAPSPHFGIDLQTHTARFVGTPEMEQSMLAANDAAKFLVCTLLDPPTIQERTYRFLSGDYSWTSIFSTLEKIQGVKWTITQKTVEEVRANQKKASTLVSFKTPHADLTTKAIETGDVDAELAASHQVIQGTGRTLLPGPYDNDKFPEVKTLELDQSWREILENTDKFALLGLRNY